MSVALRFPPLRLRPLCLALGVSLGLALPTPALSTETRPALTIPSQLPGGVRPLAYRIHLTPNQESGDFEGEAEIDLLVGRTTRQLTFHAADLNFAAVTLKPLAERSGPEIPHHPLRVTSGAQTATLPLLRALPPGRYRLLLRYRGKIADQVGGLFRVRYASPEGPRQALFTQLENAEARRVFPAWDEPQFKAPFEIAVTLPADQLAVSNMPERQRTPLADGRVRIDFAPTPPMSSYLVFLAAGDFERRTRPAGPTEIGVVTRRGAGDQADYALEANARILETFNDYFSIPYPLPKLDNVAAPGSSQFFSAMENWGAVFAFEHSMLLDPSISTQSDRQRVFATAAHEVAHQWFGNLVTMAWWDDLWLNESFASWMEGETTARLNPSWHSELRALAGRERAMTLDALATTHPVVQPIRTVDEASQAFDAITYQKGEAVVRMLEAYMGSTPWREGLRQYLQQHAYGNAVSTELWQTLEKAAGKPLTPIARDFTRQPGIPLIRVLDDAPETKGGGGPCTRDLMLEQGEFSRDQLKRRPLQWQIPVALSPLGDAPEAVSSPVMTLVTKQARVPGLGCGPVLVNAGQKGYFRTLYGPRRFAALRAQFGHLSAADQLGILGDTWALGLASYQGVEDTLALIEATPVEANPQVWSRIVEILRGLDTYYRGQTPAQAHYRERARAYLNPVFARVGWTAQADEAPPVAILRGELIEALGILESPALVAECQRLAVVSRSDPGALPAALRKPVLRVVAHHADPSTWETLRDQAAAETNPLAQEELYRLVASPQDPALAQRALNLALNLAQADTGHGEGSAPTGVSAQLLLTVSYQHPDLAVNFALHHLDALMARVDGPSRSRFLPWLAEGSGEKATLEKLARYTRTRLAPASRRPAETAMAKMRDTQRIRAQALPRLTAWLTDRAD